MKGIWAIQGKLGEEGIVYESLFLVDGEETEYLGEFATENDIFLPTNCISFLGDS